MPAGLNTIMNKYELLKKAWEDKKLQDFLFRGAKKCTLIFGA